jgi:hypothetical protein
MITITALSFDTLYSVIITKPLIENPDFTEEYREIFKILEKKHAEQYFGRSNENFTKQLESYVHHLGLVISVLI